MSQGRKDLPAPSLFCYLDEERLYAHIPQRHFYEQLARLLDLEFVRELTAPLYADRLGRPSLDPVVFFKAMLVGFFENILGDRELEFRLADSLVLRRFLGYGIEERTPDESTLRKTRQKMPEEVFDQVFQRVLAQCRERGLVKGRALGSDSTTVDANASLDSLTHRELGCTYEQYVLALRRQDAPEASHEEAKAADRQRPGKGNNRVWRSGTDPEARVAVHADKHTALSYRVDATVDLETGAIVAAGVSPASESDQDTCLQRVDEAVANLAELGLEPTIWVADKGHHSGENLAGIEERGLIPLVSAPRRPTGPAGFEREAFTYEAVSDTFTCPAGASLTFASGDGERRRYRAPGRVCRGCPHFGVCTKNRRGREVAVSRWEPQVVANRERVHSEAARPLLMIRRQRGERPFGYFKQYGGLARFNGRGQAYAEKKTLLAAAGWNLLLLVKQALRGATEELGAGLAAAVGRLRALLGARRRPPTHRSARSGRPRGPRAVAGLGSPGLAHRAPLSAGC